jgi:hypothetical protein
MTGDFAVDVPMYDAVFAALAKQWPQLDEELKVCEWVSMVHQSPAQL